MSVARPLAYAVAALVLLAACGDERTLILATTTSTENSGLLEVLVPAFEAESGYRVKVIAVGSGAALELGRNGDADVLLVHSPEAEEDFVAQGHGVRRTRVMYNDFIIVGPPEDPASVRGTGDAADALNRIAAASSPFISRGDDSGTHALERALWRAAGREAPRGEPWYAEAGQGMSATLTIARERGAYALTDRATWLSLDRSPEQPLLLEGDDRLFNVYHVIVVDPQRHTINERGAEAFRAFLVGPQTQVLIGEFGVERYGAPLFVPFAEGTP